jgi:hypothetical protein
MRLPSFARARNRALRLKTFFCAFVALVALSATLSLDTQQVAAKPPLPKALQVDPAIETATETLDAGVPQSSTTATITFMTVPYVTSVVTWGKKSLGKILPGKPLVVVRPRDSGPLDVMVRAPGYLPVQTRAHTFSDTRVTVKLTRPDKKNELLGYRIPLEAGLPDGAVEGGVPYDAGAPGMPPPAMPMPAPVPAPAQPPPSMY